jgi:hypothetical protein
MLKVEAPSLELMHLMQTALKELVILDHGNKPDPSSVKQPTTGVVLYATRELLYCIRSEFIMASSFEREP